MYSDYLEDSLFYKYFTTKILNVYDAKYCRRCVALESLSVSCLYCPILYSCFIVTLRLPLQSCIQMVKSQHQTRVVLGSLPFPVPFSYMPPN